MEMFFEFAHNSKQFTTVFCLCIRTSSSVFASKCILEMNTFDGIIPLSAEELMNCPLNNNKRVTKSR